MKKFTSNNPEESKKIAQDFARKILTERREGSGALILALYGDLGSGKTTFAQNLAEAIEIKEKIKSPTFIIMRKHEINPVKSRKAGATKSPFHRVYHFDFYRIHGENEILNLGWEEIISNPKNLVLVEWADKIEKILPKNCVKINLKHLTGNKREIMIK